MKVVHRSADNTFFASVDGGRVMELVSPETSALCNVSVARVMVDPGVRAAPHWHERTEEIYFIISGRVTAHLNDESFELGPGDALCIPRGAIHNLENTTTIAVEYLAISSPPYDATDMCWPVET